MFATAYIKFLFFYEIFSSNGMACIYNHMRANVFSGFMYLFNFYGLTIQIYWNNSLNIMNERFIF